MEDKTVTTGEIVNNIKLNEIFNKILIDPKIIELRQLADRYNQMDDDAYEESGYDIKYRPNTRFILCIKERKNDDKNHISLYAQLEKETINYCKEDE